jgi:hypothetical protein
LVGRVLPEGARGARRRFDWQGAAAITGSCVALVHARARHRRPRLGLPTVLGDLTASAALPTVFVTMGSRTTDPLLPLELFRSRTLSTGVVAAILGGAARVSIFVLALYLQQALAMAPSSRLRGGPNLSHQIRVLPRPAAANSSQPRPAADAHHRHVRACSRPPVAATFTAIGISVSGRIGHTLGATGFSAALTAASAVALATAALGTTIARARP